MSYQVKIPSCAFGGVGSIEKVKEVIKKETSAPDAGYRTTF